MSASPSVDAEMTRLFDFGEMTAALSRAKDSAPGTDLVTAAMLRNLPEVGKQRLLILYNEAFNNCSFPSAWFIIKIVPILKKGAAPDLAASYRPIALISSVKKCLEVMLKTRLERFVESRSILPTSFSGFRKGRGTNDNICALLAKIHETLSRNHTMLLCFIDIKSAFDNVSPTILRNTLESIGIQ